MMKIVKACRLLFFILALGLIGGCSQSTEEDEEPQQSSGELAGKQPVTTLAAEGVNGADGVNGANGETLYLAHCKDCHEGTVAKAPPRSLLEIVSPGSILMAMETGVMQAQAANLNLSERRAVVEYLTGQSPTPVTDILARAGCAAEAAAFDYSDVPQYQGWGITHDSRRNIPESVSGLTKDDIPRLKLKWAFAYPNAIRARSQPALAGGALYVGSHDGTVFALDHKTGCVRWTFRTVAEVRTAIVVESWKDKDSATIKHPKLFFGDLVGNVYAVDAVTGDLVWRDRPSDHPSLTLTAAPVLYEGRLYVPMSSLEVTAAADPYYACCTFRGGIMAYDAESGDRIWTAYTITEEPKEVGKNAVGTPRIAPSGAPIWAGVTLDEKRRRLYVGTGENYSSPAEGSSDAIIAFDLDKGALVWKQQMTAGDAWNMGCEAENRTNCPPEDGPDYDFGAAPILATTADGKDILLAGQKSGDVYALDPDQEGKILWQKKMGRGGIQGGVHFGMAVNGEVLYVPMSDFYGGPRWPGAAKPGMYAVDIKTGDPIWSVPAENICAGREFCDPGFSAAATFVSGTVMAGGMDGHLRAYDGKTGAVIWDFDTVREFESVSGEKARGGSIGGAAGPLIKDRMMYINSGYGLYFHMPGNALLAFSVDDAKSIEDAE